MGFARHARQERPRRALPVAGALLGAGAVTAVLVTTSALTGGQPGGGPTSAAPSAPSSTAPAAPGPTGTAQGPAPAPTAAEPTVLTILSAGDVLPHATVNRMAQRPDGTYDFAPLMAATRPWTEGADLALCSLEVPLAPPGEAVSAYPMFGAPAELVPGLESLGWDGCATATNHSMDRGTAGVFHTLDMLEAAGMGAVGTARTAEEAAEPQLYVLERAGREVVVAHLAATTLDNGLPAPPSSPWAVTTTAAGDTGALVEQARTARAAGADLVVVSMHWGTEYVHAPIEEQLRIGDELAASGQVDLVLGNHSHVPQPLARLDGGPDGTGMWVAWSMGNFISNQDSACCTMETATGTMVTATVTAPSEGPARVTDLEWTAVTVDRAGGQRIHPLHELVAGSRPDGLSLAPETIAARAARVAEVMAEPERTDPPEPTGPEPEVLPR
ncbi:CapA family protein [Georgenia sp. M64]|uniref:CapA family protein n=1 Tax=Georgenia sp. M64 TaxID=3120520 RepID=UPI0030DE7B43